MKLLENRFLPALSNVRDAAVCKSPRTKKGLAAEKQSAALFYWVRLEYLQVFTVVKKSCLPALTAVKHGRWKKIDFSLDVIRADTILTR